jgi:hypothetical protein
MREFGSGEPAAPRRQSLLRFAARSFPRRPPAYVLRRRNLVSALIRCQEKGQP